MSLAWAVKPYGIPGEAVHNFCHRSRAVGEMAVPGRKFAAVQGVALPGSLVKSSRGSRADNFARRDEVIRRGRAAGDTKRAGARNRPEPRKFTHLHAHFANVPTYGGRNCEPPHRYAV